MSRRWPALAVIVGVLVVLFALGDAGGDDAAGGFGRAETDRLPQMDPTSALSSTWFCAGATDPYQPETGAGLEVLVTNAGGSTRQGTLTFSNPAGDQRAAVPFEVGAETTVVIEAADHLQAPTVSALVEVDGGDVAVEQAMTSPRGRGVGPCASQAASTWYFANGVTERDARQSLLLFNPFPDDVVVDIRFSTDGGRQDPAPLQGLPIAAGTTAVVPVQDFVRRQAVTAASVEARTGRLVAARVQTFDGTLGRRGYSLATGASVPGTAWVFPDGFSGNGVVERWHVYNPADREAEVSLELVLDEGELPLPFDLTIPPHTQAVILGDEERVPAGVAHTSTVRSLNGVGVVVERSVDARPPAARRGWASGPGAPAAAIRWVFPAGSTGEGVDHWVVVHNPGARQVEVSVVALANGRRIPIEGLQRRRLGPAERLALRLGDHIERSPLPIVVEATGPVVAERDLYAVGATGLSAVIGIPAP